MPMQVKEASGGANPVRLEGLDRVAQMVAERRAEQAGENAPEVPVQPQAVQPPASPQAFTQQQVPQTAAPALPGEGSDTVPAPIQGEEGAKLESLTGQETDEQLAAVVPNDLPSDRKYERIRKLAVERNEAVKQAEALQAQNAHYEAQLRAVQAAQQAAAPQGQPPVFEKKPYNEPKPDREKFDDAADYREANTLWKAGKKAWDYAQEQAQEHAKQSLQAVASFMKPYVEESARSQVERQWDAMEGMLRRVGVSRPEIESAVTAMIQRDPSRSLRGAVIDVLDYQGMLNENTLLATNGNVPSTSTPGSGRTRPARAEKEKPLTDADKYRAYLHQAAEYGTQGRIRDSLTPLAQALSFKIKRPD